MKIILALIVFHFLFFNGNGQSLAINTDGSTAHSSAMMDVKSSTKGILIPRMSKAQRIAITTPSAGLLIYQNAPDSNGFYYYDGAVWQWLNTAAQNNENWKINGNSGTNPISNFIGTSDVTHLILGVGATERLRVTQESELGINENDPVYALDVSTQWGAIENCAKKGIRIKTNRTSNCETGLFMGYPSLSSGGQNDAIIWNYGNAGTNDHSLTFGLGGNQRMRLTNNGLLGLVETSPNYSLDIKGWGTSNCLRNGLRINGAGAGNECDNGLFFGYDDYMTNISTSIWNFNPITSSNQHYIRFGFGSPTLSTAFEAMRILPSGRGVGIGVTNPLSMVHIQTVLTSPAWPGIMVTNPSIPSGDRGFYTGMIPLSDSINDGYIWNFQNAPIKFGTNYLERMRITKDGNVGIGTTSPSNKLSVAGNANITDSLGIGTTSPSNKLSVTGNANITDSLGIGISTSPNAPLQFSNDVGNRKIVLYDVNNNNHQFYGFGINGFTLRYQTAAASDDHVFYSGSNSTSSLELMRIKGNGNVGIGTNNPSERLHVIGNVLATGLFITSDARYKKHIQPVTNSLEKLQQLNGVTYQFNQSAFPEWKFDDKRQYGLIAQEVEKVFPEMVKTIDEKGYKGVDYVKLIPVLLEAIKELKKEIDLLKRK